MKKNVMFIIGQLRNGGAERVISNLCNDLKNDYNITLVVRSLQNADSIYIPDVNIVEINELATRFRRIIGIIKLRSLKKKLHIDTTISFHLKYNVYNYLSKYHDKVIVSIRNYTSKQLNNYSKLTLFIYKKVLKRVNIIVNVSNDVMNDTINLFDLDKEKSIVIPNYIDINKIDELKNKKVLFQNMENTIISVGRLAYQKGIWHLIKAMKKVVEYDNRIKLLIIGRGPLKEDFDKLIQKLELDENIFILDFQSNIYKYLFKSKIFILPSLYEGMPNILLESLACDLPIIATDSFGGTKEILMEKSSNSYTKEVLYTDYGILIPNFSCDYNIDTTLNNEEILLSKAIIKLLSDKKLYNKYQKLTNKRKKEFEKEKILKLWKRII